MEAKIFFFKVSFFLSFGGRTEARCHRFGRWRWRQKALLLLLLLIYFCVYYCFYYCREARGAAEDAGEAEEKRCLYVYRLLYDCFLLLQRSTRRGFERWRWRPRCFNFLALLVRLLVQAYKH